jgi:hypothetical protein
MRTDGLYAFDEETRRDLERMLAPRQPRKRTPRARTKRPRPESLANQAARAWIAHKEAGGNREAQQFAAEFSVTKGAMAGATWRILRKRAPNSPAL